MSKNTSTLPTIVSIQSERSKRGEKREQISNKIELSEARKRIAFNKA
jgi:hypothetical protein